MKIAPVEYLIIFIFFILLCFAIYMIIYFYVCDNQTCKAFITSQKYPANSKEQALSLLNETGNDGIWPFALIGSSIIIALDFWLLDQKFTVKAFTIAFLVGFIVIYCLFSFYAHHYIKPINKKVAEIILNTGDSGSPTTDKPEDSPDSTGDSVDSKEKMENATEDKIVKNVGIKNQRNSKIKDILNN
jgi:hypothetical protein